RMANLFGLPYANPAVAVNSLLRRVREMEATFCIPSTLKKLDVDPDAVCALKDEMVEAALADTCTTTNPRQATGADLENLLAQVTPF
ncbi:iron-containing alcohol dehydrogenase, partial [Intestinibacillus massiliensis]|nr:iron-containing alcohol dehydrogenase [Intestinibacillus massiliensis]